jgi:hypothetical protein
MAAVIVTSDTEMINYPLTEIASNPQSLKIT